MSNYFSRTIKDNADLFEFFYATKEQAQKNGKPCVVSWNGSPFAVITHLQLDGEDETYECLYFVETFHAVNKAKG